MAVSAKWMVTGLAMGLALQMQAAAQEPRVGVRVGYAHSDNVGRASAGEVRSSVPVLGVTFNMGRDSQRLNGALVGDLEYRRYSNAEDLLDDDEVLGSVDGRLAVDLVPERVAWDFEQSAGQVRTDPFAGSTPQN